MALPIGTIIRGRYLIQGQLSEGGFGDIYLVRDQYITWQSSDLFVLKEVINPSKHKLYQITLDAMALRLLQHQALPHVYNVLSDNKNNRVFVQLEYIEGQNLEMLRLRQPEKRFSFPQAITIMTPIMDAVAYLHGQRPSIVHQDIKPVNIIVSSASDKVTLVNFGVEKRYNLGSTAMAVRHSLTPYEALEQYNGETSTCSDIYGLGATFYTLLTGIVPVDALYRAGKKIDPLEPVNLTVPAISKLVAEAIHRAMSLDSTDRFPTVQQFEQALNAAVSTRSPGPSPKLKLRLVLQDLDMPLKADLAEQESTEPMIPATAADQSRTDLVEEKSPEPLIAPSPSTEQHLPEPEVEPSVSVEQKLLEPEVIPLALVEQKPLESEVEPSLPTEQHQAEPEVVPPALVEKEPSQPEVEPSIPIEQEPPPEIVSLIPVEQEPPEPEVEPSISIEREPPEPEVVSSIPVEQHPPEPVVEPPVLEEQEPPEPEVELPVLEEQELPEPEVELSVSVEQGSPEPEAVPLGLEEQEPPEPAVVPSIPIELEPPEPAVVASASVEQELPIASDVTSDSGDQQPAISEDVVSSDPAQSPVIPEETVEIPAAEAVTTRSPIFRSRKPGILLAIAVALLVGISLGVVLLLRLSNSGSRSTVPTPVTLHKSTPIPSSTASAIISGSYKGTIYSVLSKVTTPMSLAGVQQSQGNISGYFTGLQVKGHLTGIIDASRRIQFTVMNSAGDPVLSFDGAMQSDGNLAGSYCSLDQKRQCSGDYGIWSVSPASASQISFFGALSFLQERSQPLLRLGTRP